MWLNGNSGIILLVRQYNILYAPSRKQNVCIDCFIGFSNLQTKCNMVILQASKVSMARDRMGAVHIRHCIREFCHPASRSVDTAGWHDKMASIELWIQWCNAQGPIGGDQWRSRDLRSAECASLTTRILHNSPPQSVTTLESGLE